jgi:acetyl esterase
VKDRLFRAGAMLALSEPLASLIGRKRRDGVLDPQIATVVELQRLLRLPPLESMEPARARAFAEEGLSPLDVAPIAMANVIDTRAAGVPVRIYVPRDATPHWVVYFHGGGGVIGSIRASDPVARLFAHQTGCTVASVGYRLGPEDRHPAAIEDSIAAYEALVPRVRGRIAVAGDSFGGFLAAHVDHSARHPPDLQVLIYPIVDLTLTSPSIDRYADGYLLTRSMIHWFRNNYLHPEDDRRAASPKYWPSLRGAAPAVVITAGFDPLVDEGDAYVEQLRAAGTEVRHRQHPSLVHGFLSMGGGVRAARAATDEICADIRDLLVR